MEITRDAKAKDLPLPQASTVAAAGLDLRAALTEPVLIAQGERSLIPTGLRIALPPGFDSLNNYRFAPSLTLDWT